MPNTEKFPSPNLSESEHTDSIQQGDTRSLMMNMSGITTWMCDVETGKRILDAGPQFFPELENMKDFMAMLSKVDAHTLQNAMDIIIAGHRTDGHVMLRIADKESPGGYLYLDTFLAPKMENGTVKGVFFLTKDVSICMVSQREVKVKETLLNAQKEKLQGAYTLLSILTDRLPCLFFAKDIDHDFRYYMANPKYCELLGKSISQVIRHTDKELYPAEMAERFLKSDIRAIDKGTMNIKEETEIGGVRKVWNTQKFFVETPDKVRLVVCMSQDVTEIYDAYDIEAAAKVEAQRSDKMKSMFLQNVCHELVTPLNSILGFSRLLVNAKPDEDTGKYSDIIKENGTILKDLIEETIELSKVEAGVVETKKETFDLSAYLRSMEEEFASKVKKDVTFKIEAPHRKCIVTLDKGNLSKIIRRGVLTAMHNTFSGYVALGFECVKDGVNIYVEDTGIGLTEDEKTAVNGQYEKLNEFTEGMAFSLSLSKILAKILGGKVDFTSEKGEKTRIWIWLPTNIAIS